MHTNMSAASSAASKSFSWLTVPAIITLDKNHHSAICSMNLMRHMNDLKYHCSDREADWSPVASEVRYLGHITVQKAWVVDQGSEVVRV